MCREMTQRDLDEQVLGDEEPFTTSAEHRGSCGLPDLSAPGPCAAAEREQGRGLSTGVGL